MSKVRDDTKVLGQGQGRARIEVRMYISLFDYIYHIYSERSWPIFRCVFDYIYHIYSERKESP